MGLAASQARFLCITARKADCEYKTTALAQEKLDITKQLGDISTQYAQAMNATKLIWSNEAVASDYGLSYSLMMMPTAANDYNPYMITSPSGAIVLNSEYAAAAKAAGISKAGGIGSQESRDKFIAALAHGGLITNETAKAITKYDFEVIGVDASGKLEFNEVSEASSNPVDWNPAAGMGAAPLDKAGVQPITLSEMCLTDNIGKDTIDWGKMFTSAGQITKKEAEKKIENLNGLLSDLGSNKITRDIVEYLQQKYNNYQLNPQNEKGESVDKSTTEYAAECARLKDLIFCAENVTSVDANGNILSAGVAYVDSTGNNVKADKVFDDVETLITNELEYYKSIKDDPTKAKVVDISTFVYTDSNGDGQPDNVDAKFNTYSNSLAPLLWGIDYAVVENGVINHYADEISNLTLADVLTGDIVLMSTENSVFGKTKTKEQFRDEVLKLFSSMVATLGYSKTEDLYGTGLYVDEASKNALAFAYDMIERTYLNTKDIQDVGSKYNSTSMVDNSAYQNAVNSNRIGSDETNSYWAVSLSNMMSAFLTYYENALSGVTSPYAVGVTIDTSDYVTDNLDYYYMAKVGDDANSGAVARAADFYDQVYNNILEHGWREDAAIDDSEYLESALKDGRYSMTSLNQDGYHYQTRYNETGYMVEVSDTDAIARAEAEFTAMKAQLTYKEDTIDMKTKKLDAEISALSTEYDTVKNLISKSIEKTFAMFQN